MVCLPIMTKKTIIMMGETMILKCNSSNITLNVYSFQLACNGKGTLPGHTSFVHIDNSSIFLEKQRNE